VAKDGKVKAKGRKPTGGKPKGGTDKVEGRKEGKEMEGGVEGEELKFGGLHQIISNPTNTKETNTKHLPIFHVSGFVFLQIYIFLICIYASMYDPRTCF
jgi:hypothetical protein